MQEYKLFVGNLPPDISQEDLRTVFNTYGMVTDVHIMTGRSQSGAACAFVHYGDQLSADQAIAALNKAYKIRIDATDPITVSYAKMDRAGNNYTGVAFNPLLNPALTSGLYPPINPYDPTNAYNMYAAQQAMVGGAPGTPGADFLNPLYNPLNHLSMLQKGNNATSGGPGGMGGGMFNGKKGSGGMNGYSGTQKGPRPGRNPHPNHPGKIFVGNLPTDITKEVLRQVFSTYGVVTDVHVMVGKSDSGQACAFVEYQQQIEAQTAINTLNNNYEIREGCGKIVCRFYEKPDSGRPGGLKGETSSTFHSGSTYKGGYGQGSQTTSYYGQGGKKGSGKGRYSSDHSSGYGNRYRQEDSYSKDKNNNLNAEPQKSPMIQQQHAAFLSASPNKDKPNGPQESANLSTPQNDERADRGFRKTSPAQKVATKSTTGSPGEEGASTESPSQVALVA